MKRGLFILFILVAPLAWGESEADLHVIPWHTIAVEFLNVALLIGLLVYFLRRAVIDHFQGRLKTYVELVDRAETARSQAEKSHREINRRLQDLQLSAEQNVQRAHAEAAELKQRLISEAQTLAKKVDEEAVRTVHLEVERAKNELRTELLGTALEASRETLKKSLGTSEQKRLQSEFVDKIQVVGQ